MGRRVSIVTAAVMLVLWTGATAGAITLVDARARGFTVCANPDALPFSNQDRAQPGFQLEIADAVGKQLGARVLVHWIVYTRHARRAQCDALMGSIVQKGVGKGPRGTAMSRPYVSNGYMLVVPGAAQDIRRIEDITQGKVGVEHTSWPHYVLSEKKIATSSFGGQLDLLDAVAKGEVVAGFATDAYVGWYLKQHPGAVKIASAPMPDADFRWNVAMRLLDADQALVDAVNQSLERLIADRTIPDIFAKYGITYNPPQ